MIFFLIYELGYGGQERQMSNAFLQLKKTDTSCKIFVWSGKPDQRLMYGLDKYENEIIFLEGSMFSRLVKMMSTIVASNSNATVLHSWSFTTNFYARASTIGTKCKAIGAMRSDFKWFWRNIPKLRKIKATLDAAAPRYMAANSMNGKKSLDSFRRYFFRFKGSWYLSNKMPMPKKLSFQYEKATFRSLSVGSLLSYKRWDFLIEVIAMLKKAGIEVEHKHLGANGPLRDNLQQLVDKLNLANEFEFVGQIDNVSQYYREANYLLHTSEVEGSANAIIEALAHGLPVFSSNCGDAKLLITNEFGVVFNEFDAKFWSERIVDFIKTKDSVELRSRIAEETASKFGSDTYVSDLFEMYSGFGIKTTELDLARVE